MAADDVVKILGTGLSGFGFLMMFLAYGLLRTIIHKPHDHDDNSIGIILKSINRYMVLCFVMTLVVGTFTFINTVYKQTELNNKNTQIAVYNKLQQKDSLANAVVNVKNDPQKVAAAQVQQKKVLDTISKLVQKQNDTALVHRFNNYQKFIISYPEIVKQADGNKAKVDSLTLKYNQYNHSINKIAITSLKNTLKN